MAPYVFPTRVSYGQIGVDLCLNLRGAMELMQEAAVIHSAQSGYSVLDVERTGVVWLLVQWHVRMEGKALWNTPVDVTTWPQTMEKLTSNRCFRITDRQGTVITVAESSWLLLNADTGRVMRIPDEVAASYDLNPDGVFDQPMEKLGQHVGELVWSGSVQRRDLDTNHHVNNLVYLEYAREALPESLADKEFPEVIVRYHRQLLMGDTIHCFYERTEQGHQVQICGEDPKHIHCTVLFVS